MSTGAEAPVALVTGSAKRTGRAMVERLAAAGYRVWVHYRGSAKAAVDVAAGIKACGGDARVVQGDVSRADEARAVIDRIAEAHGRLDVLVNNVGIYRTGPLDGFAREDFHETLTANLLGPFDLIQRALPLMRAGSSIVNLGVGGLEFNGAAGKAAVYNCSKAGLLILTRSFAEELGPRGIRVNMISPGHIDNSVDLPEDCASDIPLGRPATTGDICNALLWLVGPQAAYITGQNLQLDGGMMLSLRPDRWSAEP